MGEAVDVPVAWVRANVILVGSVLSLLVWASLLLGAALGLKVSRVPGAPRWHDIVGFRPRAFAFLYGRTALTAEPPLWRLAILIWRLVTPIALVGMLALFLVLATEGLTLGPSAYDWRSDLDRAADRPDNPRDYRLESTRDRPTPRP